MKQAQWEIVILKPTSVFCHFLASQIPQASHPDPALINCDNTAYLMHKQANHQSTVAELESCFQSMFHHEICRWLGSQAFNEIEQSFIDFMCCFEVTYHTHYLLMEPSHEETHQLLRLKPRPILLQWMEMALGDDDESIALLEKVTIEQVAENSTLALKNFQRLSDIKDFMQTYYSKLFKFEMKRMCDDESLWPEMNNYSQFCRYFSIDIHTQLIHMTH